MLILGAVVGTRRIGVRVILDDIGAPVVLAPMAGGPSTPELTAAVTEAGGFGILAAGYLSAGTLAQRIAQTRQLTSRGSV